MKNSDICYLAGLIDSDGYIGLNKYNRPDKPWGFFLSPRLIVTNTRNLKSLQKRYDLGRISCQVSKNKKHRSKYRWVFKSSEIHKVGGFLLDKLLFKKRQFELLLEYLQTSKSIPRRSVSLLAEYRAEVLDLCEKISCLNRRHYEHRKINWCLEEQDLGAYLAGFVDGDGCLSVVKTKSGEKEYYYPRLIVGNTNPCILYLQKIINLGSLSTRVCKNDNWNNCYIWSCQSRQDVLNIIQLIGPFLQLKKEQGCLIKEFFEGGDHVKIYERLRILNRKGN